MPIRMRWSPLTLVILHCHEEVHRRDLTPGNTADRHSIGHGHTCIFRKASARVSLGSPLYPFGTPFALLDCRLLAASWAGPFVGWRLLPPMPKLPCRCTSLKTSSAAVRAAS